jgi:hypothetical protein
MEPVAIRIRVTNSSRVCEEVCLAEFEDDGEAEKPKSLGLDRAIILAVHKGDEGNACIYCQVASHGRHCARSCTRHVKAASRILQLQAVNNLTLLIVSSTPCENGILRALSTSELRI